MHNVCTYILNQCYQLSYYMYVCTYVCTYVYIYIYQARTQDFQKGGSDCRDRRSPTRGLGA